MVVGVASVHGAAMETVATGAHGVQERGPRGLPRGRRPLSARGLPTLRPTRMAHPAVTGLLSLLSIPSPMYVLFSDPCILQSLTSRRPHGALPFPPAAGVDLAEWEAGAQVKVHPSATAVGAHGVLLAHGPPVRGPPGGEATLARPPTGLAGLPDPGAPTLPGRLGLLARLARLLPASTPRP